MLTNYVARSYGDAISHPSVFMLDVKKPGKNGVPNASGCTERCAVLRGEGERTKKALAASRLAMLKDGQRRSHNSPRQICLPGASDSQNNGVLTQAEAADLVGASTRNVKTARVVDEDAEPEIIEAVEEGESGAHVRQATRRVVGGDEPGRGVEAPRRTAVGGDAGRDGAA